MSLLSLYFVIYMYMVFIVWKALKKGGHGLGKAL